MKHPPVNRTLSPICTPFYETCNLSYMENRLETTNVFKDIDQSIFNYHHLKLISPYTGEKLKERGGTHGLTQCE